MASIKLQRVYEPVRRGDGARILVERLWPRGIKKEAAHIDQWFRELAPSTALRKWFGHVPARWREFRHRYTAELRAHKAELDQLRTLARSQPVTLIYSARDTEHNAAVVLREVLLRHRSRIAKDKGPSRPSRVATGGRRATR
ncbi:MAG TPA: DUF488 family protein [Pseudolabrys sp.]|nr:DUF488 family protein [Pseudolabrys sp.]